MAFQHNGVSYSNKDAYNTAKATQSPKSPAPGGPMAATPHEGAVEQPADGQQDTQQVAAALQQATQELQSGQQPSPEVAQTIVQYFEQFTQGDGDGDESGDPMSHFDQQ